jgi:diaminopimelate decarboxylase
VQAAIGFEAPGFCERVPLESLAEREGTPLHVYSSAAIRSRLQGLQATLAGLDALVCYAVKANSNQAILRLMAEAGAGADIVSGGELWRCLRAGIPAERIVFSGVGKRREEIEQALDAGIARFNIESYAELELLQEVAAGRRSFARASVRVNPDVDARTHAKISTGKAENKFGVSMAEARSWFRSATRRPNVRMDGLHMHIGSQLLQLEPIRQGLARLAEFWRELVAEGHGIASIDVGGGLGVRYREGEQALAAADYVAEIRAALAGFEGRILLEPGRYLVAEAGLLLTRVLLTKKGEQRDFLVLDAAMNDLVRPTLYDAWHDIERVAGDGGREGVSYDVVGPVCETGDTFARARQLPRCEAGELMAIRGTGAYGMSMALTFNSRPLAAEVLVEGDRYAVVKRRQTFEELVAGEQFATQWRCA